MNLYLKSFLYLLIFSGLHFGYEFTHFAFLVPFCGINESIFQHLKMGFWAYFLASGIEFALKRKNRFQSNFWYSRLFSSTLVPWFIFLLFLGLFFSFGTWYLGFLEDSTRWNLN